MGFPNKIKQLMTQDYLDALQPVLSLLTGTRVKESAGGGGKKVPENRISVNYRSNVRTRCCVRNLEEYPALSDPVI
jgi:hypothetical protein